MSSYPRDDFLQWESYFMSVAVLSAMRSKDPSTKVGAVLVLNDRIVGLGYNGMPTGISDTALPWNGHLVTSSAKTAGYEQKPWLETKYPYVCHGGVNAVLNSQGVSLEGSVLYTTLFPSADSCKLLVQAGVKEMVYLENKYERHDAWVAARRLLMFAGVQVRKYRPPRTPAQKVGEETLSAGGGVTHSAEEETEARKAGLIGAGMVGAGSVECERSQYNKISADAGGGTSINKESSGKGFLGRGAMLRAVSGFLAGWMLSQLAAGS